MTRSQKIVHRIAAAFAALFLLVPPLAQAQEVPRQRIDELARDVSRVEAVRNVKDLQRFYAQYLQLACGTRLQTYSPKKRLSSGVTGRSVGARRSPTGSGGVWGERADWTGGQCTANSSTIR